MHNFSEKSLCDMWVFAVAFVGTLTRQRKAEVALNILGIFLGAHNDNVNQIKIAECLTFRAILYLFSPTWETSTYVQVVAPPERKYSVWMPGGELRNCCLERTALFVGFRSRSFTRDCLFSWGVALAWQTLGKPLW